MSEDEMRYVDVWRGKYQGIGFEINCQKIDAFMSGAARDAWTYYVYLPEPMIPEDQWPRVFAELSEPDSRGRRHLDYYKTELADIHWHHGITFYEILADRGLSPRIIKAGCDYSHYWDAERGYRYHLDEVHLDVKQTIKEARARFGLRWWCNATGDWFDTKEQAEASSKAWRENYKAEREKEKAGA